MIDNVRFDSNGLVPAVIQDYRTGEVLMLAYMNEVSLNKTIETGTTHFYSRSRKELWIKGETSGNYQYVREIRFDCDRDAVLVKVEQKGVACHTGERSCFYNKVNGENSCLDYSILYRLEDIIKDRRENPKEGSYTNYLLEKGIDKILKKIGEESAEIIIGAKNPNPHETIYEMADFFYHCLVLLNEKDIAIDEIFRELGRRFEK